MSAPQLQLDFAGPRVRTSLLGGVLLIVGLIAATAACLEYRSISLKRAGLELKLAAALRRPERDAAATGNAIRMSEEAAGVARELGTPWTGMLADLEAASQENQDRVALLSIEPDHEKHRVRINGESRDLSVALAYIQRLQASHSLRYPMLDSHEVVAEDKDHPVRFAMTADWQESP